MVYGETLIRHYSNYADLVEKAARDKAAWAIQQWLNGRRAYFANGDPIDLSSARVAGSPSIALDSSSTNIYVAFVQQDTASTENHIFLSRIVAASSVLSLNDATWDVVPGNGQLADRINSTSVYRLPDSSKPEITLEAGIGSAFAVNVGK